MNYYENVCILSEKMTETRLKEEIEEIKKYFNNVKIVKNHDSGLLGKKQLAYPIKDNKYGYVYITYFIGNETNIMEIERFLRVNENVIKFMTVKHS